MIVGRLIGWLLVIAALTTVGHDIWGLSDTGHFQVSTLGQLWAEIHRGGLSLPQPTVQRSVPAWLWDWLISPLLQAPAVLTLVIPGALLIWLCRRRDRRRRH